MRIGGRYTLRERIGHGGMGEVWLARDEGPDGFQKTVVIKRLLPEAARYLDYFKAEARLVAQLPHSNIVQVLNFFVDEEGRYNIVMEYVEGTDVEDLIFTERGQLSVECAVYIAAEACKGLEFAHTARIDRTRTDLVHRDVSPHNLLVSYGAEVKLTDFGVAKASLEYREKTQGNKFRGKLSYAPPEAIDDAVDVPLDRRADVYGMGVVLWEMLGKRRAFSGSMWQTIINVKEGKLPPLRELNPEVSPELAEIVGRMMHPDRDERYPTAAAARADLVRAVPEWAVADQALKEFVRTVARRKPRLTSPFLEEDRAPAPIAAGADETTRKHSPAGGVAYDPTALKTRDGKTGDAERTAPAHRARTSTEEERAQASTALTMFERVRAATRTLFVIAGLCVVTGVVTWKIKRARLVAASAAAAADLDRSSPSSRPETGVSGSPPSSRPSGVATPETAAPPGPGVSGSPPSSRPSGVATPETAAPPGPGVSGSPAPAPVPAPALAPAPSKPRALDTSPLPDPARVQREKELGLIRILVRRGQANLAADAIDRLAAAEGGTPYALLARAETALQAGRYEETIALAGRSIAAGRARSPIDALLVRAQAELKLGRSPAAAADFHRALKLDPTNEDARAGVARAARVGAP
jgi:serine/threonine-protein kinase